LGFFFFLSFFFFGLWAEQNISFSFRQSRSFPDQVVSHEKLVVGTDRPDLIIIYRVDEEMWT